MSTGAISSLGIGSNGTLSYDVIDQLKEADKSVMVKPIERNILKVNEKQAALQTLKVEIASFKDATDELSSDILFANREVKINGNSVTATVSPGVDVQNIEIEVKQLAKHDVFESNSGYSDITAKVATGDSTLKLVAGGVEFEIEVDSSTSLEDLRNKINEIAGERVTASILNTGGSQPYKLIIKAVNSGEDNKITLSDLDGNMNTTFNNIQEAQNAEFIYNGVAITRQKNDIDDLVFGVKLTLLEPNDTGKVSKIEITQDNSGLSKKIENFVERYNRLMTELDELTKYDQETGESGLFLGESTINKLKNDLTRIITYTDANRRSLRDFGIELQENGRLQFNDEELKKALDDDVEKINQFFVGSYEEVYGKERLIDGVFKQFSETIDQYTNFATGIFKFFGEQLDNEAKSLNRERMIAIERLDQKYQTMAARFAAYDNQIAAMNSSFQALQMQIMQAMNRD